MKNFKTFNKIVNRSDRYQNIILELSLPHELLDIFQDSDALYKRLNPWTYNDEVEVLQDQLKVELWRIIEENLSERQKEIVKLCAMGMTQMEVAKKLGINQSSIVKALNITNSSKKNKGKYASSGGIATKLRKALDNDPVVKEILQKIADIRDADPF